VGALEHKVAVVTGASNGIGRGVAARFVREGASVFLLARGSARLDEVAAGLGPGAIPLAADVGDPDSVRAAFSVIAERFDKLDILVNNAAIYRPCRVELLSDEDISRQAATNLLGPVYLCREAIPLLRAAGGGDIINTSSESTLHPFPMLAMYVATKAALEAFSRVIAHEVREDDIRVTTVVQGTAQGAGGGTADFAWDAEHGAAAFALWGEMGLLSSAFGRLGGQEVEAVADVYLFVVTRPRTQTLDTVFCRSF
jgi:NAD(P)-dependent dehydrogenase (short-subunit alcohol dehydrogenase family)